MNRRRSAASIAFVCVAALVAGCGTVPGQQDATEVVLPDAQSDGTAGSLPDGGAPPDVARAGDAAADRTGATDGPGAADRPAGDASRDSACQPEQCNGRDDDCDGVIDNGCPIDQRPLSTRMQSSQSPVYGSMTEVLHGTFTDQCPDGQVITGLIGNAGSGLDSVGVNCGIVAVREDRSTTPYQYSVAVSPGMQYAPAGGTGGGQNALDSALLCGIDEVVTSIQVSHEPAGGACATNGCPSGTTSAPGCPTLYGLNVSCAKLAIRGTPGAFTLAYAATPTLSAHAGGTGRSGVPAIVDTFACAPAGVIRSADGATGPWPNNCTITVVNGLQLTCTNPVLPVR
jgi:hypothetical protein